MDTQTQGGRGRLSGVDAPEARHPPEHRPSPGELWRRALDLVGEYKEYAAYLLGAKLDGLKLTARNVGVMAALGVVGLIALSAVVTTAVVLLLAGGAWGLGVLFGGRIWLGALVVGFVVLAGLVVGVLVGMRWLTGTFRKQMVKKYEQRKRWQRGQFGRNVDEAAAAARLAARLDDARAGRQA